MTTTPDKPTEQLSGLMNLRAEVAVEVMGWKSMYQMFDDSLHEIGGLPPDGSGGRICPHWESDRTAAGMVLARVKEMGLMHRLCHYLLIASGYDGNGTYNFVETGLLATPEQICLAALMVFRERSGTP